MYNFKQIGGIYQAIPTTYVHLFFTIAGLLFVIFVFWNIYASRLPKEKQKIHKDLTTIPFFFFGLTAIIGIGFLLVNAVNATKTYEGVFKITDSNANIMVDDDSNDDNRKITIEDKNGNRQVLHVKNDDGIFKKGHKVFIQIKRHKDQPKPTVTKPLDSLDIEKIKQVD